MPKFLRKCGFVDMKKMRYCFSFHGNTNHIHLHMAFVETAPNHINRDGKILYRRKGKITSDEKNFFKNELLISIERHKVMRPLLMEVNQEIDEFKKYFDVQDIDIQRGRKIVESDIEWNTNVCVIGTEVATDLFGTWDAVNGTVIIGDSIYKVVGVLEEQGSSLVGSDDSKILIPYSTASRMTGQTSVSSFYIKAASENTVNAAISSVEMLLLQITRDEDSFDVSNQSDVLDTMDDVANTMSLLLAGIAAISLLVGGIGIMNILLVSVTERTRDIGIRKAVGAKRKHIMLQFLCEACILTVLGGIIGLVLSFGVVEIYSLIAAASVEINWGIGIAAIIFCAVIGVLFGGYPAAKASRLQPIDALHTL